MEQSEKNTGLFDELMEATEDINQWREGKISLNAYTAEPQAKPKSYTTLRAKMTPGAILGTLPRDTSRFSVAIRNHTPENTGSVPNNSGVTPS